MIQVYEGDGVDHEVPVNIRVSAASYSVDHQARKVWVRARTLEIAVNFFHAVKTLYLDRKVGLVVGVPEGDVYIIRGILATATLRDDVLDMGFV